MSFIRFAIRFCCFGSHDDNISILCPFIYKSIQGGILRGASLWDGGETPPGAGFLDGFLDFDCLIRLSFGVVRKDFIHRHAKGEGDAESQFQGGGVFFLFHGDDGLPRDAHFLSQFLLSHLVVEKTQFADVVAYPRFAHLRTPFDKEPVARYRPLLVRKPQRKSAS